MSRRGRAERIVQIAEDHRKTRRNARITRIAQAQCCRVEFVSSGRAARALGVSLRSLQQWAHDGLIQPDFTTPGGHYRWDVERLREWLRDPERLRRDRDR